MHFLGENIPYLLTVTGPHHILYKLSLGGIFFNQGNSKIYWLFDLNA